MDRAGQGRAGQGTAQHLFLAGVAQLAEQLICNQ